MAKPQISEEELNEGYNRARAQLSGSSGGVVIIGFILTCFISWTHILRWPEYLIITASLTAPAALLISYLLLLKKPSVESKRSAKNTSSFSLLWLLVIALIFSGRLIDVFTAAAIFKGIGCLLALVIIIMIIRHFLPAENSDTHRTEEATSPIAAPAFKKTIAVSRFISIWLLLMTSALIVNRWLDNSEPKEIASLIVSKNTTRDKHGNTFYHFSVVSPVSSPLPFNFSDTESFMESDVSYNINVSGPSYESITPGHMEVIIKLHKGCLGIPWYEGNYRIHNV